jgi:hypothetical protein
MHVCTRFRDLSASYPVTLLAEVPVLRAAYHPVDKHPVAGSVVRDPIDGIAAGVTGRVNNLLGHCVVCGLRDSINRSPDPVEISNYHLTLSCVYARHGLATIYHSRAARIAMMGAG